MKILKIQSSILLIALIIVSAYFAVPSQFVGADTISFTCTATVTSTNAGVGQVGQYTLTINNTGSAKLGSANFSIPAGYTNLIASSLRVSNTAGQTWTSTVISYPTINNNGTVVLSGSASGLSTNQTITVNFVITNPATVNVYQWLINANQNTGAGGHDYQVYTLLFNQLITPAIKTTLSCYPSASITAGNTIYDTAQLTGTTPDATGSVTYTLYMGTYPYGTEIYHSQVQISANNLPSVPNSETSPILTQAGQYYYIASYSGDNNNFAATGVPESFTVEASNLNKLSFTNIPSPQTAGNPFIITIKALDQYDNILSDYTQTNNLVISTGTLNPTTATFTNGICMQPVTVTTTGTQLTLSTSDLAVTGTSNPFDVNAATGSKLVYTAGANQQLNAGQISSAITVQLQGQDGSPVTTGATISLATTSTAGIFYKESAGITKITSISIPAGSSSATFYYLDTKVGNPTIVASVPAATSAVTQFTINTAASGTTQLAITAPESTVAGQPCTITVTAQDKYGNTVTNYQGTISFSSTDNQAILPPDSTLTNGAKAFTLTLKTAGLQTVMATDKSNSDITGSGSINVVSNNANPSYITVDPSSATINAGQSQAFTANLFDSYGNPIGDVTSSTSWSINSGDGTFVWTSNSVTVNKQGNWIVTASYNGLQATASLTVTADSLDLDHIVINPKSATIAVGDAQVFSVEAFDAYGNSLGIVTSSATFAAPGATVTGNSVSASSAGTYTVTSTFNGKSDTATLVVQDASPSPSPSPSTSPTVTPTPTPPTTSPSPTPTQSTTTSTTGSTTTTYSITFNEQGLPDGTSWNVTFSGQTKSSTTPKIVFTGIKAGDYSWSINGTISQDGKTRYVLDGVGTNTIKVPSVTSQNIVYKTQYYLFVTSDYGNPTGEGWYNAGSTATFTVDSQSTDASGKQYAFSGWTGVGDGSYTGSNNPQAVTMIGPIAEIAHWEQASILYSVLLAALIILLLILLAIFLAWRRRKKKEPVKATQNPIQ